MRCYFNMVLLTGCLIGSSSVLSQEAGSAILSPLPTEQSVTAPSQQNSVKPDLPGITAPVSVSPERRNVLESYLAIQDPQQRYLKIVEFAKESPWITLSDQSATSVHLLTYLLQRDAEEDAALLVKNRVLKGWISYVFIDSIANDFMFAIQGGHIKYLEALVAANPEGINTPFTITMNGDQILPLSVLADNVFVGKPFYEGALRLLLTSGANPAQAMPNGLTAITVASSAGNTKFVQVLNRVHEESTGGAVGLLENVRLNAVETAEMQAIMDSLLEKSMEDRKLKYSYVKLHEFWIQLILKGYNTPANEVLKTLESYPEFSISAKTANGLDAMTAAAMSRIYGGNVDYMRILVEKGANPHQLYEVPAKDAVQKPVKSNLIEMALYRDNYKVVAFLITKGVNFILTPDAIDSLSADGTGKTATDAAKDLAVISNVNSGDDLSADLIISEALSLKAFSSALVIKEALTAYFDKMKSEK